MLENSMRDAERMIGKFFLLVIGMIVCSLLLMAGMGFIGLSLYLELQTWLSPTLSALVTGVAFLLTIVVAAIAIKFSITPRRRGIGNAPPGAIPKANYRTMVKEHPATCLSLAVAAGYLYESQPKLKEQVGKMLVDLAEVYTLELTKKTGRQE